MNSFFYGCQSLKSLPNISLWDIGNVKDLSNLFYGYASLIFTSSESKEKSKITDMNSLFDNTPKIKVDPDISVWNTQNVTNMSNLFDGCTSLKSLPDISKCNTENVSDIGKFILWMLIYYNYT